jgi:pyruvate dehydrogenase E2 component (dihydrolipoamide acetyltransferase)
MAPFEFRLPDVGEGIDAAELVAWHVAPGDEVREDQPLCDIQTDKAIVALPCPATGTVAELRAEVGETVAVGEVLAVFSPDASHARAAGSGRRDAPRAAVATDGDAAAPAAPRPLASPATRRRARELGIDLAAVSGSGPQGRILREDLDAGAAAPVPAPEPAAPEAPAPAPAAPQPPARAPARSADGAADEVVPLTGTRRAIARSLTHAWRTIPHIIDHRQVDASRLLATRAGLRTAAERDPDLARALTVTPLLVKIAATALRRHPRANAAVDLEREEVTLYGRINVGIAVAAPDGLVVPVIHDADRKSVHDIAREAAELTRAARERRLRPDQLAGLTFTVNNYGSLGIWLGTPIIPPGTVCNLGLGRVEDTPVAWSGEVVIRPILPIACSGDHRLLDGDTLAAFVSDVARLVEEPSLLLGELR